MDWLDRGICLCVLLMLMAVPRQLLRNLRHPANPGNTPLDDLEVSTLASLFVRLRAIYQTQERRVVNAFKLLIDELQDDQDVDPHRRTSYNFDKEFYGQQVGHWFAYIGL
jgi:hypothetical protein